MAKTKRNIGQEILDGIRQIKRGQHGRITNVPSVASVREKTGLSQLKFATLLGVSVRTLQEWEQGRLCTLWGSQDSAAHCSEESTRPDRGRVTKTVT